MEDDAEHGAGAGRGKGGRGMKASQVVKSISVGITQGNQAGWSWWLRWSVVGSFLVRIKDFHMQVMMSPYQPELKKVLISHKPMIISCNFEHK